MPRSFITLDRVFPQRPPSQFKSPARIFRIMSRATLPIVRIATSAALFLFVALLLTGCSNSLFKVKPVDQLPALPSSAASMNVGSLSFRASPLLTDEEAQELFESNLHLAGLLPVRLEVVHNSGEAIEVKK